MFIAMQLQLVFTGGATLIGRAWGGEPGSMEGGVTPNLSNELEAPVL
jgi:hypothetical protein